jgi:hypothetical protein
VIPLTETNHKKLAKYLKKETLANYDSIIAHFRYVQTDADLERIYYQAEPVIRQMQNEIIAKNDDGYTMMLALKFLDQSFALRADCQAECTAFVINFDLKDFQRLAAITQGDKDDRFFQLKIFAEGDLASYHPYWLTFFERTWDYGGGVQLGNGRMFQFLKDSYAFQKETSLFKKDLNILRNATIENMEHTIYMASEEKVMQEISNILKASILSPAEKKRIQTLQKRNTEKATEPPLQFDCATHDCDWGG